jgi:hypothetical protein
LKSQVAGILRTRRITQTKWSNFTSDDVGNKVAAHLNVSLFIVNRRGSSQAAAKTTEQLTVLLGGRRCQYCCIYRKSGYGGRPMTEKIVLQSMLRWKFIPLVLGSALLMLLVFEANRQSSAAETVNQLSTTLRGPAQIARFTVYDAGIFPREAQVRSGPVVIRAEDLSGEATTLLIRSEARQLLGQVVRGESQSRGSTRLTLTPGTYQICDAGKPTRCATLLVEP